MKQKNTPSYEIILVDDGSTDHTPVILQKLKEKYSFIKVITQQNLKQSAARNNGLDNAKGKYVMFIDSDDTVDEKMLSLLYKSIEKEKTDLSICGIQKVFSNRTEDETVSCLKNSKNYLADYLTKNQEMDVGLWNKLFKRKIIEKNQLRFENGNFFEDTIFVFKYLCNITHGISFIEEPLYFLTKREKSTTTSFNPDIEKYGLLVNQKMKDYIYRKGFQGYERYLSVHEMRIIIHLIHHHLKFNTVNKHGAVKELLSRVRLTQDTFLLPFKYQMALILLKVFPQVYEKMYLSKKSI